MEDEIVVPIRSAEDVIRARKAGRDAASGLGLGIADQTRLATAISELTRNVTQYAGRGRCRIRASATERGRRIEVVVEDSGPGIPDLERAMTQGYSTSGGLGAGLPGTRRLVDEFAIATRPGATVVTIALNRSGR